MYLSDHEMFPHEHIMIILILILLEGYMMSDL